MEQVLNEKNNEIYSPSVELFNVKGAGNLSISTECNFQTDEEGFLIGVEWGKNGFTGGLLSKSEAIRLANHILASLK